MVHWLVDDDTFVNDTLDGEHHPNRPALDAVIADPLDEKAWQVLRDDYTNQAPAWSAWVDGQASYDLPLRRGLQRLNGTVATALEVGAGSTRSAVEGSAIGWQRIISDVAPAMIERNPARVRVAADVRALPFRAGSIDLICGLNAIPHVNEFNRVLSRHGAILWATSFGPHTPMYVSPDELQNLFPAYVVTAQRVAAGDWCLLERIGPS